MFRFIFPTKDCRTSLRMLRFNCQNAYSESSVTYYPQKSYMN